MTQEGNNIQPPTVQSFSPNSQQRRRRRRKARARRANAISNAEEALPSPLQIQTAGVNHSQSYDISYQPPQTARTQRTRPPPPPTLANALHPSPPPPPPPPPSVRTYRNRRQNGSARLHSAVSPVVSGQSFQRDVPYDSSSTPSSNRRGGPRRGGYRRGTNQQGFVRSEAGYPGGPQSPQGVSTPNGSRNHNRQYRARRGANRGPARYDHSNPRSSVASHQASSAPSTQMTYNHRHPDGALRGVASASGSSRSRANGEQPMSRTSGIAGSTNIALATQMLRTVAEQLNSAGGNNAGGGAAPPTVPRLPSASVSAASAHLSRRVHFSPSTASVTTTANVSAYGPDLIGIGSGSSYAFGLNTTSVTSTTLTPVRPGWVQLLPTRVFTAQNAPRERECAICFDDLVGARCRVLPCFHAFHVACVDPWFETSDTCPLDRKCVPHMLRYSRGGMSDEDESWSSRASSAGYHLGHHTVDRRATDSSRVIAVNGEELSAGVLQSFGRMFRNLLGL